jgi:RNA polymerase sigma-70 factor, ECF subfamily
VSVGENERLEAARAGDRRAFDLLCQTYRQEIYALCFRFLNRREDAEDVVQEVFSRAWLHLSSYRREATFRTWLWEIGRNLCLNQLRARKSRLHQQTHSIEAMPENERERTLDVPDTRPTPEETTLDAAHLVQIRGEIARCAAEKKWEATDWELFLLRMEKSIPYSEFAQRQGRDEAYWRNRWRDKIKPVLERVRENLLRENILSDVS